MPFDIGNWKIDTILTDCWHVPVFIAPNDSWYFRLGMNFALKQQVFWIGLDWIQSQIIFNSFHLHDKHDDDNNQTLSGRYLNFIAIQTSDRIFERYD